VLPTGQILFTDGSTTVQAYTASGTYQAAWEPTISSVASTLTAGSVNNLIHGTQFNGLSQGAAYGDDAQMATNYPLVRITNNASGDVFYCKTHNHSTMGVATGTTSVSTEFDIPSIIPTGASELVVVANGIPSNPVAVTIETAAPSFIYTGSMTTSRYLQRATLLNNGNVLVVGGYGSSGYLSSAEIYNTSTGTFSATQAMSTGRDSPTATLLTSGLVLVAGGENATGYQASAQLYNSSTGTFSSTGNLVTGREGHTATLLSNGEVLITGGYGTAGELASAELYNPSTGTFSATGSMTYSRMGHSATLLNNGMVLITGGYGSAGYLSTAELFNPSTGKFTVTGNMNSIHYCHTATLLNSGLVLVAGGFDPSGFVATAELYNSSTGTFTLTSSLNTARDFHTATLLSSGEVLIAAGEVAANNSDGWDQTATAELYNPTAGTFSYTASLNTARELHTATILQNGLVLLTGGQYDLNGDATATAELYQ
jgi:hypothetical protein